MDTTSDAGPATIAAAAAAVRLIRELTRTLDLKLQADREFFARRADRSYRVRRSFQEEGSILQFAGRSPLPGHLRLYTAVWQIRADVRARVFFAGPPGVDTDLADAAAKVVFDDVHASTFVDTLAAYMPGDTGGQP